MLVIPVNTVREKKHMKRCIINKQTVQGYLL